MVWDTLLPSRRFQLRRQCKPRPFGWNVCFCPFYRLANYPIFSIFIHFYSFIALFWKGYKVVNNFQIFGKSWKNVAIATKNHTTIQFTFRINLFRIGITITKWLQTHIQNTQKLTNTRYTKLCKIYSYSARVHVPAINYYNTVTVNAFHIAYLFIHSEYYTFSRCGYIIREKCRYCEICRVWRFKPREWYYINKAKK